MATHYSVLAWEIPWTEEPVNYSPGVAKRHHCNSSSITGRENREGASLRNEGLQDTRDGAMEEATRLPRAEPRPQMT